MSDLGHWVKTGYEYDIGVNVVHQTNVDDILGSLVGVQREGLTITENYYSDSRVQAKLTTIVKDGTSDGYIKNARLRIVLFIPEKDFAEELVTGYVSDVNETSEHGYIKRQYTVEGTIWGLLEHKVKDPVIISDGACLIDVWSKLIETQTKMQYSIAGAQDHVFGSTIIYEAGSNLSSILFDISEGYSRMDVDTHGRLTLKKYTTPARQAPSLVIDYNDLLGLAIDPISKDCAEYEAPGRAIVTATISITNGEETSQEVLVGSYDSPATDPSSIETRGWLKARLDSYSGLSDVPTVAELNDIAKQIWESAQEKGIEYSATSVFANYHAGDVATLITPIGWNNPESKVVTRKVLIKSVMTSLGDLTQELSLKEV